jgi:hypothetical protein
MPSKVYTGAKAYFSIITPDGAINIAYASNCSYNWNHNLQPVELIGKEYVEEHSELGMTVDFTCTNFRVYNRSAIALGLQPKLQSLLAQPELVVVIKDKVTNDTLLRIDGVKMTSRSGTVDARGAWTETLSFVGRQASDEAGA